MSGTGLLHDVSVIVPAAGRGVRMGDAMPKQYLPINGVHILQHVLHTLLSMGPARLTVALAPDDKLFATLPARAGCSVAPGGATRAESVMNGLMALALGDDDWVMVHDAARPCITAADVARLVESVGNDGVGGILATPVVETVKRTTNSERIDGTISRDGLWLAQTPQLFRFGLLKRAIESALGNGREITDEASAVEWLGLSPILVQGRRDNIKVTTPDDLALAEYYLRGRAGA